MAQIEVILPKMGESVAEATITNWLKSEGDMVEAEEAIVEIATDKVDSEVPSPAEGKIIKILVQEGEVAQVGQPIVIIGSDGDAPAPSNGSDNAAATATPAPAPVAEAVQEIETGIAEAATVVGSATATDFSSSDRFYSPLVKSIAKTEGISIEELEGLTGSGKDGRVTKKDILSYVE